MFSTMGVRTNFSRGGKVDIYPVFHVVDDATHMDVHKTLYLFNTIKKMPPVTATVPKVRFVGSNASFSLRRLFTPYKTTWLIATAVIISLYYLLRYHRCLPVLPQASLQKSLDSQKNSLDLKENR